MTEDEHVAATALGAAVVAHPVAVAILLGAGFTGDRVDQYRRLAVGGVGSVNPLYAGDKRPVGQLDAGAGQVNGIKDTGIPPLPPLPLDRGIGPLDMTADPNDVEATRPLIETLNPVSQNAKTVLGHMEFGLDSGVTHRWPPLTATPIIALRRSGARRKGYAVANDKKAPYLDSAACSRAGSALAADSSSPNH